MNPALHLTLLNILPVAMVHALVQISRLLGAHVALGIGNLAEFAQVIILPWTLAFLDYRFYRRNRFTRFYAAVGLIVAALAAGSVWHLWNWNSIGLEACNDYEAVAIMKIIIRLSPVMGLVASLIAWGILAFRSRSEGWERSPESWAPLLLVVSLACLPLTMLGNACLDQVMARRSQEHHQDSERKRFEAQGPNTFALTNDPELAKSAGYPVALGYTFDNGPTANPKQADIYLGDQGLAFPGGYLGKPKSDDRKDELLVKARNGRLYVLRTVRSDGTGTGFVVWLTYRMGSMDDLR